MLSSIITTGPELLKVEKKKQKDFIDKVDEVYINMITNLLGEYDDFQNKLEH